MRYLTVVFLLLIMVGCEPTGKKQSVNFYADGYNPVEVIPLADNVFVGDFIDDIRVVAAPANHPPLSVKIGKFTYKVYYGDHDDMLDNHAYAFSYATLHIILLDPTRTGLDLEDDYLHEIMHQCYHQNEEMYEIWKKRVSVEEGFIEAITPELLDVLHNNPDVVKWLMEKK